MVSLHVLKKIYKIKFLGMWYYRKKKDIQIYMITNMLRMLRQFNH